jgi:hypothetical protein
VLEGKCEGVKTFEREQDKTKFSGLNITLGKKIGFKLRFKNRQRLGGSKFKG